MHLTSGCSLSQLLWELMKGWWMTGPEEWVPVSKGAVKARKLRTDWGGIQIPVNISIECRRANVKAAFFIGFT
jgi:hypothetical protein